MSEYKINIVQITPSISENELRRYKKCYLGISINNPIFWRTSLDAIINWLSENFEECQIIIGDYLHRHNEEMFTGKIKKDAINLALKKGDELFSRINEITKLHLKSKFIIIRWQQYFNKPNYKHYKNTLEQCYTSDLKFREAIDSTANAFIAKQLERGNKIEHHGVELSVKYILEEMAVFCILLEEGYNVEVYPGTELPVFKMISENQFPHVPEILKKRINIEIKVSKNKS